MKIRFFIFFCLTNPLIACESDNREFAELKLREIEKYHGIPANELAISGDLPISVSGATDRYLPSYMITLNRSIMNDRQQIMHTLAHEVGHAKDHSQTKFMQLIATYYACAIAVPNVLAYTASKMSFIKTALHSVSTVAGIAGAIYFHEEAAQAITRHLEKRADLIGLDYLVAQKEFKTICHLIAYLKRAQYQKYDQGPHRPSSQEEFNYTKKILKDNGISLESELKEEKNQRLNGQITLRKDNQKLFQLDWQWKPKC